MKNGKLSVVKTAKHHRNYQSFITPAVGPLLH